MARAIDKRLFDPHFILLNDRHRLLDDQYGSIDGVSIHIVGRRKPLDPRRLLDLIRLLRRLRPDLIHTVLPTANWWGLWAARLTGIRPCIGSLRSLHHSRRSHWYWIDRLSLRYLTDTVVVNSNTIRDNCIRVMGVRADKVHRIYNGVRIPPIPQGDRAAYLQSLGLLHLDLPIVSVLCRLEKNKSVGDILSAVRLLLDRNRPVTLVVGGAGPCLADLQLQTHRLGLDGHVLFAGLVRDVPNLLQCTDLFVSASRSEGFPTALLEAMASGAFVVASDIAAHREMIRPGQTGTLFEVRNPGSLADAVQEGLDHPDVRCQIARRARDEILSRFSLDEMVGSSQSLYLQLRKNLR